MIRGMGLVGFLALAISMTSCEGEKDKSNASPEEKIPDTCLTMASIGSYPQSGNLDDQFFAYSCFEGYEMMANRKKWLSDQKCREGAAIAETGSEEGRLFKKVEGFHCPAEGVIASCETPTSKVFIYNDPKGSFKWDRFETYCLAKGGQLK